MVSLKRTFNITVQHLLQFVRIYRNLEVDMRLGWYADHTTSDITPHNELSKYFIYCRDSGRILDKTSRNSCLTMYYKRRCHGFHSVRFLVLETKLFKTHFAVWCHYSCAICMSNQPTSISRRLRRIWKNCKRDYSVILKDLSNETVITIFRFIGTLRILQT